MVIQFYNVGGEILKTMSIGQNDVISVIALDDLETMNNLLTEKLASVEAGSHTYIKLSQLQEKIRDSLRLIYDRRYRIKKRID